MPGRARAPGEDEALIFQRLRSILAKYEPSLAVKHDTPTYYYLNSKKPQKGKEFFFGAASIKKSYVSFYLFALYTHPELQKKISASLKKRHQGKSCFNFTDPDEALFKELAALTKEGFALHKKAGFV
jgi:hypothetical protein